MLSRTALPLLRQRSLAAPVRSTFSNFQVRSYARQRDEGVVRQTSSRQPLRQVKASPSERIRVERSERPSTVTNPVAAPDTAATSAPSTKDSTLDNKSKAHAQTSSLSPEDSPAHVHSRASPEPEQEGIAQPSHPLPDLTKGIPSTLEAELSQAQRTKSEGEGAGQINITEDPQGPPPSPGGRGGGELPRSAYVSSSDRKRTAVARYVYLSTLIGAVGYLIYLGRNWDTTEESEANPGAPNGYSPGAMYKRMQARWGVTVSYYRDPVTTKLLPDENPDPNQRFPFVLVLSLEDMLVHSEWSRQTGYRIAKRPGVDYFLRYLSQYYELVLFTSQPWFVADQIMRKFDPYSIITHPLYREHTLYKDGGYVKDLSYLNRDLKKIIIMDTDAHHVMNQPENAIVIPKWTGDPKDQTLIQFIPFLEYLATMGFDDARAVLKSFDGKYIPAEFAKREKLLRDKFEKEQAAKGKSKGGKKLGFGSLLGNKQQAQGGLSLTDGAADGKMIWDQIREQGQKNYEAFDKKIREEGAQWLAMRDAEEKKMQEESLQSMKSGMFGWFGSSPSGDKK